MQTQGSNQVIILMEIKYGYRCQTLLQVNIMEIQDTPLKLLLKGETFLNSESLFL